MKSAKASSAAAPAWTARLAPIRPRGDADSSPVIRYVGQWGRQSPQATQAASSSSSTNSFTALLHPPSGIHPARRIEHLLPPPVEAGQLRRQLTGRRAPGGVHGADADLGHEGTAQQ